MNPIYPFVSETDRDIYLVATSGDRYDRLSYQFYGTPSYWWAIASANGANKDSLMIQPGVQLRIPMPKERIMSAYEALNSAR